jgi:hypothetical protein
MKQLDQEQRKLIEDVALVESSKDELDDEYAKLEQKLAETRGKVGGSHCDVENPVD